MEVWKPNSFAVTCSYILECILTSGILLSKYQLDSPCFHNYWIVGTIVNLLTWL